jgi:hypothetical protein
MLAQRYQAGHSPRWQTNILHNIIAMRSGAISHSKESQLAPRRLGKRFWFQKPIKESQLAPQRFG